MDSTAIKLEPGTSAEECVSVTLMEIDIEYPFIQKERPESIPEINAAETNYHHITERYHSSAMDLPNPESVSIKTEPESSGQMAYANVEIQLPDVKKECLQYAESVQPTRKLHCVYHRGVSDGRSNINMETVPIKAEPAPRQEDEGGISYTEIDIDLTDVKNECLEYSERASDTITDLKTHPRDKPHSCSHCNYSCSHKSTLTRHLYIHTGEKPHSCHHCNYSFSRMSHLTMHLRTHTVAKSFACSHCNYFCSRKSALTGHLRIHTGEKPHSCPHCNYSCSDKSAFTVHLRTHIGENPHSCSHCNYSFSKKSHLLVHLRTHTEVKPFACPHCDFSCSEISRLTRHLRTHTG